MLREHPDVLSLSEFFAGLVDDGRCLSETFAPGPVDGRQFWAIVAAINPGFSFAYRHSIPCDEQLYPYEDPAARYSSQTGVPAILVTTLPHLATDHDRLFGLLQDAVSAWPNAMMSAHFRRLFGWLAGHFGKRLWIERSGAALHMLDHILATFPEARFIHLARDGRDAAISMQGHLGMRRYFVLSEIAQHLGEDPLESHDRTHVGRVPSDMRRFLPEHFDADAFRAFRMPLPLCGSYWSFQVDNGLKTLRALPADRLLTLRYEEVLSAPKRQLDTLAAFLGEEFIDEGWSARCAATVRQPRSTWRDLPKEDALALTQACRPGFDLLREVGVHYDL